MALPELEHYLYRLKTTPAMQEAFLADRAAHLHSQGLDAAEHAALMAGNIEALWRMGVHPMLMAPLGRLYGLKPADFRARMAPLAGERLLRSAA